MLPKLFLAVIVVAVVWGFMAHYRKQTPSIKKQLAFRYTIYAILGLVLILALTGHLNLISAAVTALVAGVLRFLPVAARMAPLFMHLHQRHQSGKAFAGKTSTSNDSTVQSDYLKIVLDHDSETMHGEVLRGPHAGSKLEQLNKIQLRELLQYYDQHDRDSFELLRAFLQRQYPEDNWETQQDRHNDSAPAEMNRKEALEILGLDESAEEQDIKRAHKQLMQRLHPDRGGSQYLAAKINEAKDFLLKK